MTVVTRFPGAVGSGQWTYFTAANLAAGGAQSAFADLDNTIIGSVGFIQSTSAYGFAIPADATITSLTVEGRYCTSGEASIALTPSQGEAATDGGNVPAWTVIQGVAYTALPTVAQLNSPDFAVTAHATRPAGGASWVYLDYITLTVEYDEYVPPDLPTVETWSMLAVGGTTATAGGTVTAYGGAPVTDRGVYVSDSPNPRAWKFASGAGGGEFTCDISGLTPGTRYYVAAYAVNAAGTAYGEDVTFVTDGPPIVVTWSMLAISYTTATGGGNVVSDGGEAVVHRGLCVGTSPEPRTWSFDGGAGAGEFTCNITGLTPDTRYYFAAYAENVYGRAFGADVTSDTPPGTPTVSTWGIVAIRGTSASGGGNVGSAGGAPVTWRGVCVGTSPNPRAPSFGAYEGTGEFNCEILYLTPDTRYYVAAFAENQYGRVFGADVTFVTHGPPVVETAGIYDITATTATGGGNVISDDDEAVTSRGVCWSVEENPTTAGSHTTDGSGLGAFVSPLTGLTEGLTYNVRAYATNPIGTAYGAAVIFTATADAPPVEPPPGPPRDPSKNLLFDGTLELMVGTLDIAGSATQVRYSNTNPGGFGNLSFRLPAVAPYAPFDAQVVKGAPVTMKHGLTGFVATLFEGEVTSDVSHATIAGGKGHYDVTCAGLWWAAGQRKDFSMVIGDDAYDQWFAMDDNAKAFQVSTDGKLEIRLAAGQSAAAGDSASLYYWLGKGMGDPAASIDFILCMLAHGTDGANWHAEVSSALTPWGPWTEVLRWGNGHTSDEGVPYCFPITGTTPQALRLKLGTDSAVDALAYDIYVRLDKASVGSGVSANGLSSVSVGNPAVAEATSAHELRSGDRVFITQAADSVPTISGWRTVTVTDATHFTVPVAVTTAGGAGTFYKATRIDQALTEIAVTPGLATLASLQPGGIGNLNWGLVVRPHASRAGGIDLLAATNVSPFDYGFWENKTFHCKDRPETIPALHDYLIDSSLPGIDFDVRRATEDSPTVVKVLYKLRAEDGETSPYPDGTALAVYRDIDPATGLGRTYAGDWSDASVVLDVWNEWADLSLTTAQAGDLGDQILAWLSANAYQGGSTIAPATVPLRGEGDVMGNIIPAMTSATAPSGVASASGNYGSGYVEWRAFDHANAIGGMYWVSPPGSPTGSLQYQFPVAHVFTRYAITSANETADTLCAPKTWTFEGSNDGVAWTTLDAQTDVTDWATPGTRKVFDITNAVNYAYGRLDITASNGATYVAVGELEMMETVRAEGTKPVAYIRSGDYIEDSNLDTGPLMITGFSMDADRGIGSIAIGENRRAFVERLTPDKA